jgi:hypothetical protein
MRSLAAVVGRPTLHRDVGESLAGGVRVAEAVVNTLRRIDLSWVRIEIGMLVGALIMGA